METDSEEPGLALRAVLFFGAMLVGIATAAALRHQALLLWFSLIAALPLAIGVLFLGLRSRMESRR